MSILMLQSPHVAIDSVCQLTHMWYTILQVMLSIDTHCCPLTHNVVHRQTMLQSLCCNWHAMSAHWSMLSIDTQCRSLSMKQLTQATRCLNVRHDAFWCVAQLTHSCATVSILMLQRVRARTPCVNHVRSNIKRATLSIWTRGLSFLTR